MSLGDLPKCGRGIPLVRLSLEKNKCFRATSPGIRSARDVANLMEQHYGCRPQEYFAILCFNAKNQAIAVAEVAMGAASTTQVDPKVVFALAISCGAVAIILFHNHPSGNPEPSQDDHALTKRLVDGGKVLTVTVLDHVILGRSGQYYSFQESGLL